MQQNSCVLNAIISEECKLGPWARVEGSPEALGNEKISIAILGAWLFLLLSSLKLALTSFVLQPRMSPFSRRST